MNCGSKERIYLPNNKVKTLISGLLGLVCCWLLTTSVIAAKQPSLKKISELLHQEKVEAAYYLAQTLQSQEIGNPQFDLLLGKAALAMQKNDIAVMAFERVLINDPNNTKAQLGLAQAYDKLQTTKIDQAFPKDKLYHIYGNLAFGYDNNVAAATDTDYINIINLMGVALNPTNPIQQQLVNDLYTKLRLNNKKLRSAYLSPQLGIEGTYAPKPHYNLFWNINASHKEYTDVNNYDVSQANLTLGVNYQITPLYSLSGDFYYQEYLVDGKIYSETPIITLSLNRALNSRNNLKIYTNGGILNYPQDKVLNINMYTCGLEWLYLSNRNLLITRIFTGRNQPRGGAAKYNGNNYWGGMISAQHQLSQKISLVATGTYQNVAYDEKQFVNVAKRHDLFRKVSAGIYYSFHTNYTWYVSGSYINNHSNIFPYKYNRLEALTGINFMF